MSKPLTQQEMENNRLKDMQRNPLCACGHLWTSHKTVLNYTMHSDRCLIEGCRCLAYLEGHSG